MPPRGGSLRNPAYLRVVHSSKLSQRGMPRVLDHSSNRRELLGSYLAWLTVVLAGNSQELKTSV